VHGTDASIDWTAPWFAPWRERAERVAQLFGTGIALHEALARESAAPLRFVSQHELPPGEPYESFILRTQSCPTRDNLHDFFNGLVWLAFPLAKARLNQLQAAQIEAGALNVRGPVRDAITVFDENGALLHAPDEIWDALLARDWRRLFVELRPLWSHATLMIFGHALLEKLVVPRKAITAHVWRVPCPEASMQSADRWLANQLGVAPLAAKPFTPLPLLGIPGWSPENEIASFYDDPLVFRPPATRP
jgi:hypothetical protein